MSSFLRAAARAVGWDSGDHVDSPEFTSKLAHFKAHMDDVQKVRDAMQLYSDAFETMMAAQVVLGEALDAYYKSSAKVLPAQQRVNPPMCHAIAHSFKKSMMEMYGYVRPAVHEVFVSRCIRPVTYILSRVPAVHDQIAQRKKMISAFHDVRAAIQGYKNTPSPALAKEEARMQAITLELGRLDSAITATFDDYAECRPKMLAQELAAAVACTYHAAQVNSSYVGALLPLCPQAASSLCLLQAAAATRAKKLRVQPGPDDGPAAETLSKFVSGDLGADAVVLERDKVSGGRTGGYGLVSRAQSNSRRRSLNSGRQGRPAAHSQQSHGAAAPEAAAAAAAAAAILSANTLASLDLSGDSSSGDSAEEDEVRGRGRGSGGGGEGETGRASEVPLKPPRDRASTLNLGLNRGGVRISSVGGEFPFPHLLASPLISLFSPLLHALTCTSLHSSGRLPSYALLPREDFSPPLPLSPLPLCSCPVPQALSRTPPSASWAGLLVASRALLLLEEALCVGAFQPDWGL